MEWLFLSAWFVCLLGFEMRCRKWGKELGCIRSQYQDKEKSNGNKIQV